MPAGELWDDDAHARGVYLDPQPMVRQFHRTHGARLDEPASDDLIRERWGIIAKEFAEFATDWLDLSPSAAGTLATCLRIVVLHRGEGRRSRAQLANAMAEAGDLLYALYGAGANLGVDLDEVLRRVHRANMSKLPIDASGKAVKPPGYESPRVLDLIPRQEA